MVLSLRPGENKMLRWIPLMWMWSSVVWAGGDADKGAQLYQGSCMACHGINADGNGPAAVALNPAPTNFRTADFGKDRTDEQLRLAIQSGSPGTSMMPFTHLDSAQIADLIAFLRSQAPDSDEGEGASSPVPPPAKVQ